MRTMSKGNRKKKKKGRCPKCRMRTWNGKFCEARTDCSLTKPVLKKTPRQRFFTNEYNVGDKVAVIRTEHGWFDGALEATVKSLSKNSATVVDENGSEHEIIETLKRKQTTTGAISMPKTTKTFLSDPRFIAFWSGVRSMWPWLAGVIVFNVLALLLTR